MSNQELVIQSTVLRSAVSSSKKDYSIICLLTSNTPVSGFSTNKTKLYTSKEDVAKDFGSSSITYKKVEAILSQTPAPKKVRIAVRSAAQAIIKTITLDATLESGDKVEGIVNGVALTPTSYDVSHSATMTAIATKIAQVKGINTAVASGNVITVTGTVEYPVDLDSWSVTEGTTRPNITIATTQNGRNLTDDLADAMNEVNDWYGVAITANDDGSLMTLARATESLKKLAVGLSSDSSILTEGGTSDIAYQLKLRKFTRIGLFYHQAPSECLETAIHGRQLSLPAGSSMYATKDVAGPAVSTLTESQIKAVVSKNCNCYLPDVGIWEGVTPSGISLEMIYDADYTEATLKTNLFLLIKKNEKIEYTLDGVNLVVSDMEKTFDLLLKNRVIQNYTITPPNLALVSEEDKANHILPDVKWTAEIIRGMKKIIIIGNLI